jgi:putative flippase GtrA
MIRNQGFLFQAIRYGLVGGIVVACDFAAYSVFLWFVPGAYLPANWLGKLVGAGTGFVLHKHFTYSWEQRDGTGRQVLSYIALLGFNIALSSLLLWLMVGLAGWDKYLSKLAADAVVIATAFVGSRLWVYRPA